MPPSREQGSAAARQSVAKAGKAGNRPPTHPDDPASGRPAAARREPGSPPVPCATSPARGTTVLLFLIVVAVAMLVSSPALRNGLFWDDAIVLTRQVPAMGTVRGAFFPPPGLPQF